MASGWGGGPRRSREPAERLAAIRAADGLADLVPVTGADTEHGAYFAAKREWRRLRGAELAGEVADGGIPGTCVVVDDHEYHVHGVTHADTEAERTFLRERVADRLEDGAAVYCEQGIRPMYFSGLSGVCGMDDYGWALHRCRELGLDSRVDADGRSFDGLAEDVDSMAAEFRDAAFSLIDAGRELYGEEFAASLGDVATAFLTSHEDAATGEDFASFALSRRAATNPDKLAALQRYYERAFLPQPLEREWLRRHDRELELVTHARNERMADYVVYHDASAEEVHVICGAAHQPGVRYYLERYRDGRPEPRDLELFI